ncbi:RNase A-like domain-containing protein [Bradyrhizobium sp.]|uniref:RNase A-like domain-containing protein n=1 Tax=Bradyrhizobium sp. TaxID=376 RepID=UPI0039C8822C
MQRPITRGFTPVLEEEDDNGGHTLRRHTDRTESSLIDWLNAKWQRTQVGNLEITEYPIAEGTFRSREEANDLVNQVLKRNTDTVDQVAAGKLKEAKLQERFGFVTGKEAATPTLTSAPPVAFALSSGMTRARGAAIGCTRHFRSTMSRRGDRSFA